MCLAGVPVEVLPGQAAQHLQQDAGRAGGAGGQGHQGVQTEVSG